MFIRVYAYVSMYLCMNKMVLHVGMISIYVYMHMQACINA